jgi:hypothetical protein
MWEPQRLTTLWAFTACYRDSFYKKYFPLQQQLSSLGIAPLVSLRATPLLKEFPVSYGTEISLSYSQEIAN